MANVRRVLASGLTRNGLVPYSEIDITDSVVAADIVAGTITADKINASADIELSKLEPGTDGQVISQDSGVPVWADVSDLPPTPATARPAGEMMWFAGAAAPSGWLVADGTSYLRATYADLFTAIGVLHGSADGTHFNVPNLVGKSARGSAANGSNVGGTGGSDSATLITANLPSHTHSFSATSSSDSAGTPSGTLSIAATSAGTPAGSVSGTAATHTHTIAHDHGMVLGVDAAGSSIGFGATATGGAIVGGSGASNPIKLFNGSSGASGALALSASFTGSALGTHGHSGSTFTGDALSGHTHTLSGTTGAAGSATSVDITPAHVKLLPCIKT